jgi:hypothetical protein
MFRLTESCSASIRDCRSTSSETRRRAESASFISSCIFALLKSASMLAAVARCWSRSFCTCTRRFVSDASADCRCSSAF